MFGEITLLMVLQGAALIAAGAAAGYFLALQRFDKQRDKLNDELENARTEIKEQREKVDKHFLKTALLFNRLTDNYREIYEHLATGAQTLCSPQTSTPQLDQPETRVLPAIEGSAAENEAVGESEQAATGSPQPGTKTTAPTEAEGNEKPATETVVAKAPTPEETTEQKAEAETPRPDATEVPAADKSRANDAHLGADATPAPTGASKEKPTPEPPAASETGEKKSAPETAAASEAGEKKSAPETAAASEAGEKKSAPEVPTTPETAADIDRHRSPPSIH